MAAKTISERIEAITGIPTDYRSVAPSCPHSVKIELTARRDLSCWFCATGFKPRDTHDRDRDGRFRMVDLGETPFLTAWYSGEFQKLRVGHLENGVTATVCEKCVASGKGLAR